MKLTDMQKNVAAISFFVALSFTCVGYFAKASAFDKHIRDHKEKELLEVLYECETKYPNAKEGFIAERCKDAKVEYEKEFKDKKEK